MDTSDTDLNNRDYFTTQITLSRVARIKPLYDTTNTEPQVDLTEEGIKLRE